MFNRLSVNAAKTVHYRITECTELTDTQSNKYQ